MPNKYTLIVVVSCLIPSLTYASGESASCGDPLSPILQTADFNGDGEVNGRDIAMLAKDHARGSYKSLYDLDADGVVDVDDITLASHAAGAVSSETDQQLAQMYQRFKHLQDLAGIEEISAMGYASFGGTLAFHGDHYMNQAGQLAIAGFRDADPLIAEGLNVVSDGSDVPGIFWSQAAVPLFHDPSAPGGLSTLDWPAPEGVWNYERVQAFANTPPDFFPGTEEDRWHTHAGICLTIVDHGSGPEWEANQHVSNAECQALPNLAPVEFNGQLVNMWANFWMLHVWMFDLNPNGLFANTHPCIDPDGPSESDINGDREIPPFFQHH